MNLKLWKTAELNKSRAAEIAERFGIDSFLAMMLDIRGFVTDEQIQSIFSSDYTLSDPFLIKDMDKAVERIQIAIDSFEKIVVFGDYDADGVTATAILFTYLDTIGANVMYYIPSRETEGYGMNEMAVHKLHDEGVNLIITVDNGIACVDEVDLANSLGMDVVITDHHRQHEKLPNAVAVVDPHRHDCTSEFKDLCGAGIALKLLIALEGGDSDIVLAEYSDLAALGTIADVMPLIGENRTIVKSGLEVIQNGGKSGIEALMRHSGFDGREVTAKSLAFTVIPRINAVGRMGASERAVKLLTCEYDEEAETLASVVCDENSARRATESEIVKQALELLKSEPDRILDRVIIVDGEDWHHGVIGIAASKITDMFGKPCLVISKNGNIAKGSGRSVDGFSLFDAINSCSDLFEKFGGHPMAVGITLKTENIKDLRIKVNKYAQTSYKTMPVQSVLLDCKLNPKFLTPDMPEQLKKLEPFGCENPDPVFGLFNMKLEKIIPVGGGAHLRLQFSREDSVLNCMFFGVTETDFSYKVGTLLDLAVILDAKEYRGQNQLTVIVRDIKPSTLDIEESIIGHQIYEKYKRQEEITSEDAKKIKPTRDELAVVYRKIVTISEKHISLIQLTAELSDTYINIGKLLVCLDVFSERGLIDCLIQDSKARISIKPTNGNKINIYESSIFAEIDNLIK